MTEDIRITRPGRVRVKMRPLVDQMKSAVMREEGTSRIPQSYKHRFAKVYYLFLHHCV